MLTIGACLVLVPSRAVADEPNGSKPAATTAFDAFLEGERAFAEGDFVRAAQAVEAAHRIAPHPDVLWNAARAWDRAGEAVRAANLYERYLRDAPAGARDRNGAIEARKRLAAKLGRIDVIAPGLGDVRVDEQPLTGDRAYVTPGAHVIAGALGDRRVTKTATVAAGEAVSVALVVEAKPPPAAPPPAPTIVVMPSPAPRGPEPLLATWQRAFVGAGFGLTAVSGALLIWSGVDTSKARSAFDRAPTHEALSNGYAKQTRTNVLIATTSGLGAISLGSTIVFAVLRRFQPAPVATISVGPSSASISLGGRF